MYEISLWELKLVPTVFVFAIKIKILKNNQKGFILPKKLLLPSRFSSFCISLFHFILYDLKVTASLEIRLGFQTWPTMCLEFEPRALGAWVEAMVEWLRSWIFIQEWFQDRLSLHSFEVGEMGTRYSWEPKWKKRTVSLQCLCICETVKTNLWSETIFSNWKSFKQDENGFLFHLKSCFCFQVF